MSSSTPRWGYDGTLHRWALAEWLPPERGKLAQLAGEPLASYDAKSLTAVPPAARRTVAESIYRDAGQRPPAHVFDGVPDEWVTMTCPRCWHVSFNPDDAGARYCGACHWWTGSPNHGPHPDDAGQQHAHTFGAPCPVTGCRWPASDTDALAADGAGR